jgi:hypothetical protein
MRLKGRRRYLHLTFSPYIKRRFSSLISIEMIFGDRAGRGRAAAIVPEGIKGEEEPMKTAAAISPIPVSLRRPQTKKTENVDERGAGGTFRSQHGRRATALSQHGQCFVSAKRSAASLKGQLNS